MALQIFKIASVIVETPVSTITFTSIPQAYTDLLIKVHCRRTAQYADNYIRFNSDSGSNYRWIHLRGDGASVASDPPSMPQPYLNVGHFSSRSTYTANVFGSGDIYIPNYTGSQQKALSADCINENYNASVASQWISSGIWLNTSAITSMIFYPDIGYGEYDTNSTFTLYGIL